ncbi:MAG TPA: MerR family DNA-binding transcriptional regulator [Patescibacteria group bacterium]|nr:MerR family DNA-binding transcriptional regulator [Patescibacteria group bacterium]
MSKLPRNKYISINEAAIKLGVSTKTLRRWEVAGKLIAVRTNGGHRRYEISKLTELKINGFKTPRKEYIKKIVVNQTVSDTPKIIKIDNIVEPLKINPNIITEALPTPIDIYNAPTLAPQQKNILKIVGFSFFGFILIAGVFKISPAVISATNLFKANADNIAVNYFPGMPGAVKSFLSSRNNNFADNKDVASKFGQNVQVLAAETKANVPVFNVNIESSFKQVADFVKGLTSTDVSTGTLEASDNATFAKNVDISGDLTSSSATFNLLPKNVTSLNIGLTSTTTSISATTGTTTINNDLNVKGATALSGALNVGGKITGSGDLAISGASVLSGALNVSGVTTLASDLSAAGNATFGNITKVNGVTYSFPTTQGAGGSTLTNDGSGNLSWVSGSGSGTIGFWTRTGTILTPATEGDTIATTGQIGAGTTTPSYQLDIQNPISANNGILANFALSNSNTGAGIITNGINVSATGSIPASGTNTNNLINLSAITAGSNTFNGINFGSGLSNYINSTNFIVTAAGAETLNSSLVAVGVNAQSGLLQGTGGLTLTGTTNINSTGVANTTVGNTSGTLALSSNAFNLDTSGNITGVPSLDTINVSSTALTFAGAGTIDSGTANALNLGTGNNAKTINIGTGNAGNIINIGTNDTTADAINIASAKDTTTLAGNISLTNLSLGTGSALCLDGSNNLVTCTTGTGGISGSGASGQIAYYNGASSITGNNSFFWNTATTQLGIGTNSTTAGVTIAENSGDLIDAGTTSSTKFTLDNSGNILVSPSTRYDTLTSGTLGVGTTNATTVNVGNLSSTTNLIGATNINTTGSGNTTIGNGSGTVALNLGSDATGDIYYRNSGGTLSRLGIGSSGQTLTVSAGIPSWVGGSGGTGSSGFWSRTSGGVLSPATATDTFNLAPNTTNGTGVNAGFNLQANSLTSGNAVDISSSSITSGNLLSLSSTSTAFTSGAIANLSWSPSASTTATGDLLKLNVGSNGILGNILDVQNNGSTIFGVSQTQIIAALPTQFTAAGDVGFAYDVNFTNPVASNIKSSSNLNIAAGETFNSSDLTLTTYNAGNILLNTGTSSTGNGKVGIGPSVTPTSLLTVNNANELSNIGQSLALFNQTENQDIMTASNSGTTRWTLGYQGNITGTAVNTSGNSYSYTNTALNTTSANLQALAFTNAASSGSITVSGENITATGTATSGTNTNNLVNLSVAAAASNNTFNGINFGSNLTNYINGTNWVVTAAGNETIAGINVTGLTANSAVYTDGSKNLTTSAPSSGALGYWTRTGTTLSPTTSGDAVTTSGNISTTGSGTITSASDLAVNGSNFTSSSSSFNLLNSTPTTINFGGNATTALNIGNGNSAYTAINFGSGTGGNTIGIGNGANTGAQTINIAAGAAGANSTVNILSGIATSGTQTLNLGTGASAKTVNIGNSTGATALNFTSGTGAQTFASSVVTGTTTSGAFAFNANSLTTGDGLYLNSSSITTGNLLNITSTSTAFTSGNLASIYWNPGSSTTATGDLLKLNVGSNGILGNILDVQNNGSTIFGVSQTQISNNLPVSFNAPGDIVDAYDFSFTNPVSSNIKSSAPLTIAAGEIFNSSNLTLTTYNLGNILLNSGTSTGGNGLVGIGPSVSPTSLLTVDNTNELSTIGQSLVLLNQTESQDILTASNSGTTRFKINSAGNTFTTLRSTGTAALCHTTNGAGFDEITDCSGTPAADYAEFYPTDGSVDYGDIVAPSSQTVTTKVSDGQGGIITGQTQQTSVLTKSSLAYQGNVIGIVSNNYNDFTSTGYNIVDPSNNPKPVALNGRVPVKIATDSPEIAPGDYLTTSDQPGRATKATQAGRVIGMALENWSSSSGKDTVLVFVNNTWYDPNADAIAATGSAQLNNIALMLQDSFTASDSGIIANLHELDTAKLNVLGDTTLGDTVVNGKLNVGGLTFDDTNQSINAIGVLKIQDLALGNVEFMNGLITFDTNGNAKFQSVTANKYNVAGTSAGTGTITAGATNVIINTNAVNNSSLIFVTASTATSKVLAVTTKVQGTSFTVSIPTADINNINFNWWIVDKQ